MENSQLTTVLNENFNDNEIKKLCHDLGLDYEEIKGDSKSETIKNLISYYQHRDEVHLLEDYCRKQTLLAFEGTLSKKPTNAKDFIPPEPVAIVKRNRSIIFLAMVAFSITSLIYSARPSLFAPIAVTPLVVHATPNLLPISPIAVTP